jgi:hypothetical protein
LRDLSLRRLVQAASFFTWEVPDSNLARKPTIPTANICVVWDVMPCELAQRLFEKILQLPIIHAVTFQMTRLFHNAAMRT